MQHDGLVRHSRTASGVGWDSEQASLLPQRARNSLRLFDAAMDFAKGAIEKRRFELPLSLIPRLHRIAFEGISDQAGTLRSMPVKIEGSGLQPSAPESILEQLEEMCGYLNTNWITSYDMHLASYVLWRILWIHPFADGNGQIARVISYAVLCMKKGLLLPGSYVIPFQIVDRRAEYYEALEQADKAWEEGWIDVSKLEALLSDMMSRQLEAIT